MPSSETRPERIAVIGMACRLPGSDDPEMLWRNTVRGGESTPGELEGTDLFDAAFFGVTPREAECMDPQQRIFLECCQQALDDAGYGIAESRDAVGVFAGSAFSTYLLNNLWSSDGLRPDVDEAQALYGNEKDYLTALVSYRLDLNGPSMSVNASNATSLVAIVQACSSLLACECDMALAGGVNVVVPDTGAAGASPESGAGVVVLKRLSDAERDRDHIYAVISGAACHNDAEGGEGFAKPSRAALLRVIRNAADIAGIDMDTDAIGYVVDTDASEKAALREVYGRCAESHRPCVFDSVRFGGRFPGAASGVAGLIKAVKALEHRLLPPGSRWQPRVGPRRAAVSSFGMGGFNAHVILEEAPEPAQPRRALPARQFDRRRFWIDPLPVHAASTRPGDSLPQRVAVAAAAHPRPEGLPPFAAPAGLLEGQIAAIFQRVTGFDRIGRDDALFDLGGDSLMAARLVTCLRAEVCSSVTIQEVLDAQTPAALAELVASRRVAPVERVRATPPQSRPAHVPLTHAQRRLWLLQQMEPDSAAYNIPARIDMEGALDVAALQASIQDLVDRHEVLRTVIRERDGEPYQWVLPSYEMVVPVIDVRDDAGSERWLARLAQEQASTPFDLATQPPVRGLIARTGANRYVLFLTLHHIACDGWSRNVVLQDIQTSYTRRIEIAATGVATTPAPAPLRWQYADFAVWQAEQLQCPKLRQQLDALRAQLAGAPAVLELPADFPRSGRVNQDGTLHHFELPQSLVDAAQQFAQRTGTTLFVVLLTAYKVLLRRYTGQGDIVVGSPFSHRHHDDALMNNIGLFVNTLVLRTILQGSDSFHAAIDRVREVVGRAHESADVPFETLVGELAERTLHSSPLFQHAFVLLTDPPADPQLPGIVVTMSPTATGYAKFEAMLSLRRIGNGLRGELEYRTSLFRASTAARFAEHYRLLLERLLANPGGAIDSHVFLTPAEASTMLGEWNGDVRTFPSGACIHDYIAEVALRRAGELAVCGGDVDLTYGQLYARATALAERLREANVQPDELVAVMMERGWQQVVAVLGILISGAAYLPINIHLPRQRRRTLLELGEVRVVVTRADAAPSPDLPANLREVAVSAADPHTSRPLTKLATVQRPSDLAYVIFTSGSTGVPKGVAIEHAAVLNTLFDMNERFAVTSEDRVLALSDLGFDLSVYDIFGTLLAGGVIVLLGEDETKDPHAWLRKISQHRVTIWNSVPALAEMLVAHVEGFGEDERAARLAPLRMTWMSGDRIPPSLPDRLRAARPGMRVVSLGGATEASIWSIVYPIESPTSRWSSIPYGRALANQQFHVLNEMRCPCPLGVPGDLYIGGVGLAREYWRDAVRTNESFAFSPGMGQRLYRTGDRGRWLESGHIEFLGREDGQVKIRGFRIELGEVEAQLKQHPLVRDALAVLQQQEERDGGARLVAYVVPTREVDDQLVMNLRTHCLERLPEYMVPRHLICLERLPLTANGKVDRKALATLQLPAPGAPSQRRLPSTAAERAMAAIWCDVLGLEAIGVDENFFELGGDSVQVIQVVNRARQAGWTLTARTMFQFPTVRELLNSAEVEHIRSDSTVALPVPTGADAKLVYRATSMQEGMLFHNLLDGAQAYVSQVDVELHGPLDANVLEATWQWMAQRHAAFRTHFEAAEQGVMHVVQPSVRIQLNRYDLRDLPAQERSGHVQRHLLQDRSQGFDTGTAPLMRVALFRMDEASHRLVWSFHHALLDGWSVQLILGELVQVYSALLHGQRPNPPEAVPFDRYVTWLEGCDRNMARAFWKRELAQVSGHSRLDVRLGSGAMEGHGPASVGGVLSAEETLALHAFARKHRVTLNTVIHAAWAYVLHRYCDTDMPVFGSVVSGRPAELAGIERMVGMTLNTIPVLVPIASQEPIGAWLQKLHAANAERNQYAYMPLAELHGLASLPPGVALFDSLVVFENAPQTREVADLRAEGRESIHVRAARVHEQTNYTLTLVVTPGRELETRIGYHSDELEASVVRQISGHLHATLRAIVRDGERRLCDLGLPEDDLEETSRPKGLVTSAGSTPVHEVFEHWVEQTPHRCALRVGAREYDYATLNARANQLAHYLISQGVQPGATVAIAGGTSLDRVVGLLGVLKARGTYFGGDLDLSRRPATTVQHIVPMDSVRLRKLLASQPSQNTDNDSATGTDCACIVFEQSTGGQPVRLSHKVVFECCAELHKLLSLNPSSRWSPTSGADSPVFAFEMFLPWMAGGTLAMGSQVEAPAWRFVSAPVCTRRPGDSRLSVRDSLGRVMPPGAAGTVFVELESACLKTGIRARQLLNGTCVAEELEVPLERPAAEQSYSVSASEADALEMSEVSSRLRELYRQVLELDSVRPGSDFFALGAHSLHASRLLARINRHWNANLGIREIYAHPVIEQLAQRILSARGAGPPRPPLLRAAYGAETPLSYGQLDLWFIQQLSPSSATYNMSYALAIEGALDVQALRQAIHDLAARHECLRSRFVTVNDEPVRQIDPEPGAFITIEEPEGGVPRDIRRRIREFTAQPFDLSIAGPIRVLILRQTPTQTVLLLNMHHIISDHWSLGILMRELSAAYQARSRGLTPDLPPQNATYSDFIAWQREALAPALFEAQLAYWRRQLSNASERLALGRGQHGANGVESSGRIYRFTIDRAAVPSLDGLLQKSGASLFMLLTAVYGALLHAHTDQHDILIGTDLANRNHPELEGVVGFFINQAVIRADLSGDPPFTDLLARIRRTVLDVLLHQDVPFASVLKEIAPKRNAGSSPLFQAKLVLYNAHHESLVVPGLAIEPLDPQVETAKFDLLFSVSERPAGFDIDVQYRAALFAEDEIVQLSDDFRSVLSMVCADPETRLSSIVREVRESAARRRERDARDLRQRAQRSLARLWAQR